MILNTVAHLEVVGKSLREDRSKLLVGKFVACRVAVGTV